MPTSANINAIDSYETLRAEMIELFADLSERMRVWDDKRPSRIMRKMVTTVDTVPYEMLAEFGHSYNPTLLCFVVVLHCGHNEMPDYDDARALVQIMLDDLRNMDIDDVDKETYNRVEALLISLNNSVDYADGARPERAVGKAGRLRQAFGDLARLASIPV